MRELTVWFKGSLIIYFGRQPNKNFFFFTDWKFVSESSINLICSYFFGAENLSSKSKKKQKKILICLWNMFTFAQSKQYPSERSRKTNFLVIAQLKTELDFRLWKKKKTAADIREIIRISQLISVFSQFKK